MVGIEKQMPVCTAPVLGNLLPYCIFPVIRVPVNRLYLCFSSSVDVVPAVVAQLLYVRIFQADALVSHGIVASPVEPPAELALI